MCIRDRYICFSVIRSYEDYENFQLADKKEYVRMAIMSLIKIKLFTYGKKNMFDNVKFT